MSEPQKKQSFRPSRPVALTITGVVVVFAALDQIKDGSLSPIAAGALLALVLHWSGRGGDTLLERLLEKWLS